MGGGTETRAGTGKYGIIDGTLKSGFAKIIILNSIRRKKTHPYALLKNLRERDYPIVGRMGKSEIYNILNALEKKGFVRSKAVMRGRVAQKRYELTPYGAKVANNSKRMISGFLAEARRLIEVEFEG